MEKITPELKDKVLNYLCSECIPEQVVSGNTEEIIRDLKISFNSFSAILRQFTRYGFIEDLNLRSNAIHFILLLDAVDYKERGGFTMQEEILEANINKFLLEIEKLKNELEPKYLETANKIAGVGSTIISAISLFKK